MWVTCKKIQRLVAAARLRKRRFQRRSLRKRSFQWDHRLIFQLEGTPLSAV